MNESQQQQEKDSVLKSLAIAGFIGIIVLVAWLSIQLVHYIPGAFSSLASLAKSVQESYPQAEQSATETLTVTGNVSLITVGEPITLSWSEAKQPGSFTFSYACTDGVSVDLINVADLRSIDCGTNYNIGNTTSLELSIDSEKERYADLKYTVSFLGTNDLSPRASGSASITVINSAIENLLTTTTEEASDGAVSVPPADTEVDVVQSEEVAQTPTPTAPTIVAPTPTPAPATPSVSAPSYEPEITYAIPVSDPNGKVDLSTRFLNVGKIVNNTFTVGSIERGTAGAIQFEVKNLGTKTSGNWSYTVSLPGGDMYRSPDQKALKPNERAVLTIGFPASDLASHTFVVTVDETSDKNTPNDSFRQPVTFVR